MNNYIDYKGLPIVSGWIRAPLLVVDASNLNLDSKEIRGKIVVIRIASPAIVLWLKDAAGLVVEIGGVTSHAAIFAREFNIPCIVGVHSIYDLGLNGLMGDLQGDQGILRVYTDG